MNKTTAKERIINFLKHLDVGQTSFELNVGLSRGAISKMTDESNFTGKVISKLITAYPNLNTSWLLHL